MRWKGCAPFDADATSDIAGGVDYRQRRRLPATARALPAHCPTVGEKLLQGAFSVPAESAACPRRESRAGHRCGDTGATLTKLSASQALVLPKRNALFFVKLQNAGHKLADSAGTVSMVRAFHSCQRGAGQRV